MAKFWIAQREDDTEGQMPRIRYLRPAEDAEAEEHSKDTEGQRIRGGLSQDGADDDDTIGHPRIRFIRPIDEEQGLYLVEVDSDDVTGQRTRVPFGQTEEDVKTEVRRP